MTTTKNRMNRSFSLISVFVLISFVGDSQQVDTLPHGVKKTVNDTTYFVGDLPLFQIDSCLQNLLENVVSADKNASYQKEGNIFYSLELRDHESYIDMDIWPVRQNKASRFDYFGALNIEGTLFLCWGNYRSEKLFHAKNKTKVKVRLQRPVKNTGHDEIDKAIDILVLNPSLYGTYLECPGLKILTTLYIEGKTEFEIDPKRRPEPEDNRTSSVTFEKQPNSTLILYQDAYKELEKNIAVGEDFKKSVFITESVFFKNKLPYEEFESFVNGLVRLCREWEKTNHLNDYRYKDSSDLLRNLAIYTILKDTVRTLSGDGQEYYHLPFTYDFNDFFGKQQWSNMFVSKLLISKRGNCHSLPYLYKILADELGARCWLSLAPNHMYIKNRCKKIGWYNTELTSGDFPIDAWITTSGYIPIKAVQNGIYLDTLSNQQAIALCVLDLAKGYEFQTKNYEDGFILKCCDLVLQYHPVNVQALLLKAETLKRSYEKQQIGNNPNAKETFNRMEQLYIQLFDLGYREMPEKMYMEWLMSVTKQRSKYTNKQLKTAVTGK